MNDFEEPSTLRIPFKMIAGIVGAVAGCVLLFNQFIPAKSQVDQMRLDIAELRVNAKTADVQRSVDHDTLIKLEGDLDYIRRWVEKQELQKLK